MPISAIANLEDLVPIRGVSYAPVPSDSASRPPEKYFDTDFTNETFSLLWGSINNGRGDIKNLSDIGVNFLRLHHWSVPPAPGYEPEEKQRNHLPFLRECSKRDIKVLVPISNQFLRQIHRGKGEEVKAAILAIVTEVYNRQTSTPAGAGMWAIGNEFDQGSPVFDVGDVVMAIEYLDEAETVLGILAENRLPVTAPISFDRYAPRAPGVVALQNLKRAINANAALKPAAANFWDSRFVASVNPFDDGRHLKAYINKAFPKYFPDLPFFFHETGAPIQAGSAVATPIDQASFVKGQLEATTHRANFLGRCIFQFLNQTAMKSWSETTFGMTQYSGTPITMGKISSNYEPGGGELYPVDALTEKPLFNMVRDFYLAEAFLADEDTLTPAQTAEGTEDRAGLL
ncbi:MAG: hypothetical protein COB37_05140 [Kordiimonadales bacterium]|nr:MAG: hypothetical protein COB37_05140 [Kordiimonadales bacterium]